MAEPVRPAWLERLRAGRLDADFLGTAGDAERNSALMQRALDFMMHMDALVASAEITCALAEADDWGLPRRQRIDRRIAAEARAREWKARWAGGTD